jgi:hypothetical protein
MRTMSLFVCDSCMRAKSWSSTGGSRGLRSRCDVCKNFGSGYFNIEAQWQELHKECHRMLERFKERRQTSNTSQDPVGT